MTTFARRDGSDWVLNGAKRWIGLASVAQAAVIWATPSDRCRRRMSPIPYLTIETTIPYHSPISPSDVGARAEPMLQADE